MPLVKYFMWIKEGLRIGLNNDQKCFSKKFFEKFRKFRNFQNLDFWIFRQKKFEVEFSRGNRLDELPCTGHTFILIQIITASPLMSPFFFVIQMVAKSLRFCHARTRNCLTWILFRSPGDFESCAAELNRETHVRCDSIPSFRGLGRNCTQ